MTWVKLTLPFVACAALCSAQTTAVNALKGQVDGIRQNIMEAAEKAPLSVYSYKPADGVMTFHQQLAHIADANYSICAPLKNNEANPNQGPTEEKAAGKDVIPALKASFDYCDAALATLTDAGLAGTIKRGTSERPAAYYAFHLLDHIALHYGNLITYMRANNIVPPETERRSRPAPAKK
ncbi:MAG: DinB family protein [Acidobacteria bacterium]|nr:DinB family protein [Acidobacteriota bacterium]